MGRVNRPPETLRAIESLQRLAELFGERRRQLAKDVGITEAQWRVLEEVEGESFMPSMFARRRDTSAAAVSRTLRQLLDRELVRASIGTGDGRQRVYRLTPKGRRTLQRLAAKRAEAISEIWERFSRSELAAFTLFADELADRLEAYGARR